MAGVENIKAKILKESEEKASQIIESAKAQAEEIMAKAKQEAAGKTAEINKKALFDCNEKKKISNSMIELELRKEILSTKQEAIEQVFRTVLDRLSQMDNQKYQNVIYDMLLNSIISGDEEIIISKKDQERITPALIEKLNKQLVSQNKTGNVKLSEETRNISGGFILLSKGMEINNSFEAIIRMQRDEFEPKVAKLLF